MTEKKPKPRPPRGLAPAGRRLWVDIVDVYELDPHELRLLVELCRQVDLVDELQAAVDADGVMVPTGEGGRKVNPAAIELRQSRLALARIAAALRLPATEAESPAPGGRTQARSGVRGVYVTQAERA